MDGDSIGPSQDPSLLTLDHIEVGLPVAGIGSRLLAGSVDLLIATALEVAVSFSVFVGLVALGVSSQGWLTAIVITTAFLLQWGYFAGLEILMQGRTPGKAAARLRVVSAAGGPATVQGILIRNVVRIVDYLIGVPMIALDPLGRRLGDRFGGTLVLHDAAGASTRLGRIPEGWSEREVAVAESYFRRFGEMDAGQRLLLGRRLLRLVARHDPLLLERHGVDTEGDGAPEALRRVLEVEG
ncbi:MAG: RDD family protein [Thermoanaerobaculia bacterium]